MSAAATALIVAGVVLLQPPPAPSAEPPGDGGATVAADPFGPVVPAALASPALAEEPAPPSDDASPVNPAHDGARLAAGTGAEAEPTRWPDGLARRDGIHAAPARPAGPEVRSREGWLVAPGVGPVHGTGRLLRFTVEVEAATGADPHSAARTVEGVLSDPRGWLSTGRFAFQRMDDPSVADVRVVIASPETVDRWCGSVGLHTNGWLSCQVHDRAMLNHDRWRQGVPSFDGKVELYRTYLVNHEVGHVLGYGHVGCPGRGRLAPVMMQQSKSLAGCQPNGWVAPDS